MIRVRGAAACVSGAIAIGMEFALALGLIFP